MSLSATILSAQFLTAQNTTFNSITGAPMYNTSVPAYIEWPTSNFGAGFSHKIYNDDNNGKTYLKIAARHNSATWVDHLTVTSDGFIGIGTNAPGAKLSINGNENQTTLGANVSSVIKITNQYVNAFGRRSEIQFATTQNANDKLAVIAAEYTSHLGNVGGDLVFGTSPGTSPATMIQRMRISSKGQVSIGNTLQNTSPHFSTYSLSVKGQIVAREVVVTQQLWSDFVFDKNYKLMPLNELENYYKTNHHLPEVPSTKEISESGNDLGKTDALLLQKIEELTLYIVEQQKQIEFLIKKIEKK